MEGSSSSVYQEQMTGETPGPSSSRSDKHKNSPVNDDPDPDDGCRTPAASMKKKEGDNTPPTLNQTVIRLKRRIEDSPSKLLVLSCKRSKTDFNGTAKAELFGVGFAESEVEDPEEDKDVYSQVLRLVGTVVGGDEVDSKTIATTVKNVISTTVKLEPKVAFRRNVKGRKTEIAEKVRINRKRYSEDNRYKIISCKRGVHQEDELQERKDNGWRGDGDLLKLLDLVPESAEQKERKRPIGFEDGSVTCNGLPMVKGHCENVSKEDELGYVYDLYVSNDPGIDELTPDQFFSLKEADDDLNFGEDDDSTENAYVDDDEDSNAEDNWRNDYPDSEEEGLREDDYGAGAAGNSFLDCDTDNTYEQMYGFNEDDEDMYGRMRKLNMKADNSSSEDEDLMYGIKDDGASHGISFDSRYSRYKSRLRTQQEPEYADEVVSSPDSD